MKRKVFKIILLTLSISFISFPVLAYNLLSGYYPFFTPGSLRWHYHIDGSYIYTTQIANAVGQWNAGVPKIHCTRTTVHLEGHICIFSKNYGNVSWAGSSMYPNFWTRDYATIKLNEYHLKNPAQSTYNSNFAINVMLHELGHVYGLAHNNNRSSVMYPYAQPGVTKLSSDDINGVKAVYP